jgi:hypothetical protein
MRASGSIMRDFLFSVKMLCAKELLIANDGDPLLKRYSKRPWWKVRHLFVQDAAAGVAAATQ